jgi:hypothetical protein
LQITRLGKVSFLLLLAILITFQPGSVSAASIGWTSNGPQGGEIYVLVIDPKMPTTIYAGRRAGLFKSTNAGTAWSCVNTGAPFSSVYALAVVPMNTSILYAGTRTGVYKTVRYFGKINLLQHFILWSGCPVQEKRPLSPAI